MSGPTNPTVEEWLGYFTELSNWGRWGDDDTLGPLNLVTPEVRAAAAALVTEGVRVSCARDVSWVGPAEDHGHPLHFMQRTGTSARPSGGDGASDWVVLPLHGLVMTHLDAPSHMYWDAQMYNGQPASQVTAERGARLGSLAPVADGIVGRGVLLDVAAAKGVEHLQPGYAITPDDLDEAAARQSVEVRGGDILIVRTGYGAARTAAVWPAGDGTDPEDESLPHLPGLGPSCLPWMHAHDVAVVGTDTGNEARPTAYPFVAPFHVVAMVAMGMWVVDNYELEELGRTCERLGRWEFLATLAPVRLKYSTGAPVNPVALF